MLGQSSRDGSSSPLSFSLASPPNKSQTTARLRWIIDHSRIRIASRIGMSAVVDEPRERLPDDGSYADHTAPPRMMDHTRIVSAPQSPPSFFLYLSLSLPFYPLPLASSPSCARPHRPTGVRNPCRGREKKVGKEHEGKRERGRKGPPEASERVRNFLSPERHRPGTGKKGPRNDGGPRRAPSKSRVVPSARLCAGATTVTATAVLSMLSHLFARPGTGAISRARTIALSVLRRRATA